jgi:hypothetical protein
MGNKTVLGWDSVTKMFINPGLWKFFVENNLVKIQVRKLGAHLH